MPIGANLGSMAGQWLRFSDERVRTLVAVSAAAGVAAAFNAPITGVFFAIELVIGELGGSALGVSLLTSAAVTTQALSGPDPAFAVLTYRYNSPVGVAPLPGPRTGCRPGGGALRAHALLDAGFLSRLECAWLAQIGKTMRAPSPPSGRKSGTRRSSRRKSPCPSTPRSCAPGCRR